MSTKIAFGPFVLDVDRGTLVREGRPIALSSKGLQLLLTLLRAPGQVISKADLMRAAWSDAAVEESNLSVQIAALRKQLGPSPDGGDWIATIPRVGYRFIGSIAAQAGADGGNAPKTEQEHRPSIVALPFINLGGDKEQEYLADGITEDIITALTRFRWFFVIARNSSFAYKERSVDTKQVARELGVRYVLEGSIRKSGPRVRISAQLVDATTGSHIWAERYDLELTELFAIQDEIAERVAGAIEPELLKTEGVQAAARHTGNMTAWHLVRRGTWHFHQVTRENHLRARELFREACRLDPELPEAHIWLARVSGGVVPYGWAENPGLELQEGLQAALKAIYLDERNPYSHYAFAIVSIFSGQLEQAIRAARKAIEISPSFALGHLGLGMALLFNGRASEAISPLEHGLRLSPYDPQNFVWFNMLALARLFAGRPEAALEAAIRALQVRPDWWTTLEILVCCYAELDRWDEARDCASNMRKVDKQPGDVLAVLRAKNPNWTGQMSDILRKANE
ncbi:winged helix-turn-helix domain-containing tetratricopeptide repeat protein [Bradyrhizobium sp. CCBAU 51627]|uniref:winged helix-turn-helix domain-containing tetratricopeptide repeat protein n=1 Tax=Bradyrhizobium sp. CCBAU 51627 TaxID=1325088 RepID=UPI0023058997|nr:winged helix-turn-helix domain-containing tetratricopeptide repeat protein [Bradyrhizobium sp. CCBAU 51627]MDA9433389.1 transcriptional regulator [Bradyrhizobium sp. CCBAU 51627]